MPLSLPSWSRSMRWKPELNIRTSRQCLTRLLLALTLVVTLSSFPSHAQMERLHEQWRWVSFETSSGLPSEDIVDITETGDGTPWVLTRRGLAWFDDFRWHYVDLEGLTFPLTGLFHIDADSLNVYLWAEKRLYIVNRHAHHEVKPTWGKPLHQPTFYFGGGRFITYLNHVVDIIEGDSMSVFPSPLDRVPAEERAASFADFSLIHSGVTAWLKVRNTIYRWNGSSWQGVYQNPGRYLKLPQVREDGRGNVVALIEDQPGYISVFEGSSVKALRKNPREIGDQVTALEFSPEGNVLSLNSSGDLRLRQRESWRALPALPPPITRATAIFFRHNGDLWVGTENGLYLCQLSSDRWVVWRTEPGSREDIISEICPVSDGTIWVGTGNGIQIHSPDGSIRHLTSINGRPVGRVIGIAEDDNKHVWISSGSSFEGAYRWDGETWRHFGPRDGLHAPRVHKVVKDREGRVWFLGIGVGPAGSSSEPGAYVREGDQFTHWGVDEGLRDGRVYSMIQDHHGALWFGTLTGLSRWNDGHWTYWDATTGLRDHRVFGLAVDSKNRVYFCDGGTGSGCGVGIVDDRDSIRYTTSADGLINDAVWGLAVDEEDRLWAATWNGLGCYVNGQWLSFDVKSGLPHARLWPVVPWKGKIYLGTQGGGVAILAYTFVESPVPQVVFDPPSYKDREITLRWTVNSYWGEIPSLLIPVRYKIDIDAWSPWGTERQLGIAALSSGNHILQVQARGAFGKIGAMADYLSFDVEPPIYLRPAFYVPVGTVLFGLGVFTLVYLRRKRRYEEAIQLGEQRFILQYKRNPVPILTLQRKDGNFTLIDFNDAAHTITRGRIAEYVGSPLSSLTQILPETVSAVEQCFGEKSAVRTEDRLTLGGGVDSRDLDLTCAYVPPDMVLVHARDVTFEKQAAQEIRDSQQQLRALAGRLESVREEERTQLSREIHDELGQIITGLKMDLSWVGKRTLEPHGGLTSQLSERVQRMTTLVDTMLESVRSLAGRLRPAVLDKLGLVAAIEWQAKEVESRTGIVCLMNPFASEPPLTHEEGTEVFRVFQEILTNVVRHAEAATVTIDIRQDHNQFILAVTDDGRGFSPSDPERKSSLGILGMEERLRRIGGWLQIRSEAGKGTTVQVCVPLHKEERQ